MKILVIRAAPIEQCERILRELTNESSKNDITVLTDVSTTGDIVQKHFVRIFNYDARRINVFTVGRENLKRLQLMSFDKVIIACKNHLGDGYGQIKIVALSIRAKEVELWNINGAKIKITIPRLIFTTLFWKSYMGIHFLIWFVLFMSDLIKRVKSRFVRMS